MPKTVIVIGAGFAGLSASAYLGKMGYKVTLLEKNETIGGRARSWRKDGFHFDMGPSWYWMPDVFEKFFGDFGHSAADFYDLKRLDPSYRVFFGEGDSMDIPAKMNALKDLFESLEKGASEKLDKFLKDAEYKYNIGMKEMVYKPGLRIGELLDRRVMSGVFKMNLFTSHSAMVKKYFKNDRIRKILEFPVLFLGATPEDTPALYSLMNYADLSLGTWYPMGGMTKIVDAFAQIAKSNGVEIIEGADVKSINTSNNQVNSVDTNKGSFNADVVVTSADYHFTETSLLNKNERNYSDKYWESRTMAPSCLIYYLGVNKKVDGLKHHNLFFDKEFSQHAHQIYTDPSWPDDPLFYVCCPSKTDDSVAPEGQENIFLLMPIAPGIQDSEEIRERYYEVLMSRLAKHLGEDIRPNVVIKRSYSIDNFKQDYNSFKGNAYGLANTLRQTANLKPKVKSKKVKHLYYTGQLTVPGPGVPPSIISGNIVANLINQSVQP